MRGFVDGKGRGLSFREGLTVAVKVVGVMVVVRGGGKGWWFDGGEEIKIGKKKGGRGELY